MDGGVMCGIFLCICQIFIICVISLSLTQISTIYTCMHFISLASFVSSVNIIYTQTHTFLYFELWHVCHSHVPIMICKAWGYASDVWLNYTLVQTQLCTVSDTFLCFLPVIFGRICVASSHMSYPILCHSWVWPSIGVQTWQLAFPCIQTSVIS